MNHLLKEFIYCPRCGSNHFEIHNEKSKRCSDCGFCYYLNPSAAVAAFITNEKGDLLVCKRGKEPHLGTLDLPGGFIDVNETAEEALKREITEELNVKADNIRYLFSLPNTYLYSGLEIPTLDMFFSCAISDWSTLKACDDVAEYFFIPITELNPSDFGLLSIKRSIQIFQQNCI